MSYAEYQSDLNQIYESELLGEILFTTAARLTWLSQRRRKWLLLRDLETQTKDQLMQFLHNRQQQVFLSRPVKIRGFCYGVLLALLPWQKSMHLLERGTVPFLKVYKRLEEHGDENSKAFFSYVVAHEEAIAEFASLERTGCCEHSIKAVASLLSHPHGGVNK